MKRLGKIMINIHILSVCVSWDVKTASCSSMIVQVTQKACWLMSVATSRADPPSVPPVVIEM